MRTTTYTDRRSLRPPPTASPGRHRHVTDQYRAHNQAGKRPLRPTPPCAFCARPSKSTSTGVISARLIFSPSLHRRTDD